MLTDLQQLQSSDEDVQAIDLGITVESFTRDSDELVEKSYTFSYADEWDKWVFTEFREKRTPTGGKVSDRNWRKSQHIVWNDVEEARHIEVPPEVSEKLADATGADSITIQTPS
jgi:hypothetical protein